MSPRILTATTRGSVEVSCTDTGKTFFDVSRIPGASRLMRKLEGVRHRGPCHNFIFASRAVFTRFIPLIYSTFVAMESLCSRNLHQFDFTAVPMEVSRG